MTHTYYHLLQPSYSNRIIIPTYSRMGGTSRVGTKRSFFPSWVDLEVWSILFLPRYPRQKPPRYGQWSLLYFSAFSTCTHIYHPRKRRGDHVCRTVLLSKSNRFVRRDDATCYSSNEFWRGCSRQTTSTCYSSNNLAATTKKNYLAINELNRIYAIYVLIMTNNRI